MVSNAGFKFISFLQMTLILTEQMIQWVSIYTRHTLNGPFEINPESEIKWKDIERERPWKFSERQNRIVYRVAKLND